MSHGHAMRSIFGRWRVTHFMDPSSVCRERQFGECVFADLGLLPGSPWDGDIERPELGHEQGPSSRRTAS
jgi:hypothetical protein